MKKLLFVVLIALASYGCALNVSATLFKNAQQEHVVDVTEFARQQLLAGQGVETVVQLLKDRGLAEENARVVTATAWAEIQKERNE